MRLKEAINNCSDICELYLSISYPNTSTNAVAHYSPAPLSPSTHSFSKWSVIQKSPSLGLRARDANTPGATQLPLGLLNAAQGHPMLVELKNGETLNGHLVNCDTWMNLTLKEVVQTSPVRFLRCPAPVTHARARERRSWEASYDSTRWRLTLGSVSGRRQVCSITRGLRQGQQRTDLPVVPICLLPKKGESELTIPPARTDQIPPRTRRDHRRSQGAAEHAAKQLPRRTRRRRQQERPRWPGRRRW